MQYVALNYVDNNFFMINYNCFKEVVKTRFKKSPPGNAMQLNIPSYTYGIKKWVDLGWNGCQRQ